MRLCKGGPPPAGDMACVTGTQCLEPMCVAGKSSKNSTTLAAAGGDPALFSLLLCAFDDQTLVRKSPEIRMLRSLPSSSFLKPPLLCPCARVAAPQPAAPRGQDSHTYPGAGSLAADGQQGAQLQVGHHLPGLGQQTLQLAGGREAILRRQCQRRTLELAQPSPNHAVCCCEPALSSNQAQQN